MQRTTNATVYPIPAGEPPSRGPLYLDPVVGWALLFAFVTRAGLGLAGWVSLRILARLPFYPDQYADSFFPDTPWLDGWMRWDTAHYVNLARFGYGGANPSPGGGWGFFPLYSLLMRGLTEVLFLPVTEQNLALAGLVIANLSFVALVALVARWSAELFGDQAARATTVLLCLSPFSYFLNTAYTESLFMLLVTATLMLAGKNRWLPAGLVAGLVTGTRLVGLAIIPALLLLAYKRRATLLDTATAVGLACYGVLLFGVYSAWQTGNPFEYFRAQANWGGWSEHVLFYARLFATHPRDALLGDPRHLVIGLNLLLLIVTLIWLPAIWRSLDPGVALFTTLIIVAQGAMTWVSLGRYLLPAMGLYLVIGRWLGEPTRSPWTRELVTAGGAIAVTTLFVLFAHGFWVI